MTIPRGGTRREAELFLAKHQEWILEEHVRRVGEVHRQVWRAGTQILLRGRLVGLTMEREFGRPFVVFGNQKVPVADPDMDLRRPICSHLEDLARQVFPERVKAFGLSLSITHGRITIRNQSTRWGSCSCSGNISLNWRLIQAPSEVADYVIVHELMHRKEMNHSERFWKLVAVACPRFQEHEDWLKKNARVLGL